MKDENAIDEADATPDKEIETVVSSHVVEEAPATGVGDSADTLSQNDVLPKKNKAPRKSKVASQPTVVPSTTDYTFKGVALRQGFKGIEVSKLQEKLGVMVTGVFDRPTVYAVRSYQAHKGIHANGVVGKETWESLFSE